MRKSGNSINFIDKAIVFDFDGVILDTDEYIYKSFSFARKSLGLKNISKQKFLKEFENDPKYILKCENLFLKIPYIIKLISTLKKRSDSVELTTGFKDLIKDSFSDFALFICSNNLGFIINKVLKKHGLEIYFRNIFSEGFLYKKRDALKQIAKHYSPSDVLFITDTYKDLIEAKNSKVKTIAVSFGISPLAKLKKAKPDKIAKNITELKKHINEFRQQN
ncbi:MAG TPA: HAD family hydrolase [Candidatus Woesearchaeota archaeon]|nr:HAD family hydrolase [Candidatus Woesearchaeota archaeon]